MADPTTAVRDVEQRYDEAWQRGDLDGILACLHPAARRCCEVSLRRVITRIDPHAITFTIFRRAHACCRGCQELSL